MKKTIIFLIIIFTSSGISYALEKQSSWEEILSEQLNSLNLYQLEKEFKKINQEFLTDLPWPSLPELIKGVIKGELAFDFRVFMKYFLEVFFQEIRLNLKLLGQLLVLAIIASLLELMAGAFSHEGISHLTRAVVSMVLIFIVISSLVSVLGYGEGTK